MLSEFAERAQRGSLRPFQIVSLFSMILFHGQFFFRMSRLLETNIKQSEQHAAADHPVETTKTHLKEVLQVMLELSSDANLEMSETHIKRMIKEIGSETYSFQDFISAAKELQHRIADELELILLLQIPKPRASYYNKSELFGSEVAAKFPKAVEDIQESGSCIATGRFTASVFHLMRVMEIATQYLGKRIGISLVTEKNWAVILDQVDKAIKVLPAKNSSQKAKRNRLSEGSAHLRMVKDAWRNDVMHPKETYTEEEAERVFRNVKDFMVHLATKL